MNSSRKSTKPASGDAVYLLQDANYNVVATLSAGGEMAIVDGEAPRLALGVDRDLLQLPIEDADDVSVPARPYAAANVLRRRRLVRLGHLNVPIPIDLPRVFLEVREPRDRQRQHAARSTSAKILPTCVRVVP
ncbi:MAG: hypothetical protein IH986_09150 [Planctomycetes bacterium]|nr:hypothetical protein [Planctomycetota bacterium]